MARHTGAESREKECHSKTQRERGEIEREREGGSSQERSPAGHRLCSPRKCTISSHSGAASLSELYSLTPNFNLCCPPAFPGDIVVTVGASSCQHAAPLGPYGRDALRGLPPTPPPYTLLKI
ncbi:uncharacterized [Tachysurus ichikawai]